jgi:hypothetical protein
MPDFVLPEHLTQLVIDDGPFAGAKAVVRLAARNLEAYWHAKRLMERPVEEAGEEQEQRLRELFELAAADIFVSWNVADHTGPLPITAEGLGRCDPELFGTFLGLWSVTTEQAPVPLGQPSPSTEPSSSDAANSGRRRSPRRARRPS